MTRRVITSTCAWTLAAAALFTALWFGTAPAPTARGVWPRVLPPSATAALVAAARPYLVRGEVVPPWRWTGLAVEQAAARFSLEDPGGGRAGVSVTHPDDPPVEGGAVVHESAALRLTVTADEAPGRRAAEALAAQVAAGLGGDGEAALWATSGAPRAQVGGGLACARLILAGYQTAWLLLAALLAVQAARAIRAGGRAARRVTAGLAALSLAAFALRLAFATWGPGDLWMNLSEAFLEPGTDARYGSAPNALLRLLFLVLPRTHGTVVGVSLVLGALAPAAAVLVSRALGGGPRVAAFGGLLVALQPVLVRYAGAAGRQPHVLVLALVAFGAVARLLDRAEQRPGAGSAPAVVAALAAVLCLGSRPEAPLALAPAGLLALFAAFRRPRALARPAAVVVLLAAAVAVDLAVRALTGVDDGRAAPVAARLVGVSFETFAAALRMTVVFHPDYASPVVSFLAVVGLGVAIARRDRLAGWAALSLLLLVPAFAVVVGAYTPLPAGVTPHVASARYQTILFLFAALAAAVGLDAAAAAAARRWGRRAAVAVVALGGAAVLATTVAPLVSVTAPRTADLEYRFLVEHGPELPAGATVQQLDVGTDRALQGLDGFFGEYLGEGREWRYWDGSEPPSGARWVYYHGSGCASADLPPDLRARCAAALARFGADPIAETTVPNRPTGPERHEGERLRIGFFRMSPAPRSR